MHSMFVNLAGLFLVYATIVTTVYCIDLRGTKVSKDELIALTRDHYGRTDPDDLLNGFFPVWAAIQFCLACFFFVIAVISLLCYIAGCKTPPEERNKRVK